jgi:DHA1 family L-arabinose/isopropyl-beta-D-thiogalactopyranoside export protein-like MFS transporter/DHA1 family inner membrane transport protein
MRSSTLRDISMRVKLPLKDVSLVAITPYWLSPPDRPPPSRSRLIADIGTAPPEEHVMTVETMTAAPTSPVSHRRATAALIALSIAAFCYVTTEVLPIGLLTLIAPDLHRSTAQVGLLVTGYATMVLIASLPLTYATRRIPRRQLLTVTIAVFVVATAFSAVSRSYDALLIARLLTGLTQAMFWSVVFSTATGLFPPEIRGRMVARLSIGNALAPVLGIPLGTWIGQQAGWRVAFGIMSGISLATCIAVALLVPTIAPEEGGAARGTAPDRRRFILLLIATVLGVTGAMGTFTYVTPYLLTVSGFAAAVLSLLLFAQGAAGVFGTLTVGRFLDRFPRGALVTLFFSVSVGMLGLYVFGFHKVLVVVLLALAGLSFSALAAAIQHRTMQVAPGSTDTASAGTSSAFNFGIAAGSFLGSVLIAHVGVRYVPLAGGLLTTAALVIIVAEPALVRLHRPARATATPAFDTSATPITVDTGQ